jgi:multicomponent Na+:H+ antiporter subunit E
VWLLLWGEASVANVASGLVVAAVLAAVVPLGGAAVAPRHRVHPFGVVRLVGLFAVELVRATWRMAVTVVAPSPARLRAGVVRVELRTRSPLVGTLVANLVTLTPGTLSLSLVDGVLHVHVLGLDDAEAARADVRRFESAVLAAVEPVAEPAVAA